jgi:hypothetical protein
MLRFLTNRIFGGCRSLLAAPILLALSGCTEVPQPANADAARVALQTALDAWQRGDSFDSLGTSQPPIYVTDWKWRSGAKLVRYEITSSDRPLGADLRCPVKLWIDRGKGKGKPVSETAEYNVGTHPALTVARVGDR